MTSQPTPQPPPRPTFTVPASAFNPPRPTLRLPAIPVLVVIGSLFLIASIFLFCASFEPYFPESDWQHRFKTDSAIGATANATEFLVAKHQHAISAGDLLIASLLIFLIAKVGDMARRLPA